VRGVGVVAGGSVARSVPRGAPSGSPREFMRYCLADGSRRYRSPTMGDGWPLHPTVGAAAAG
jgi:hypothetical protein